MMEENPSKRSVEKLEMNINFVLSRFRENVFKNQYASPFWESFISLGNRDTTYTTHAASSVQSAPYEKSNSAYVHIIIYVLNVCVCVQSVIFWASSGRLVGRPSSIYRGVASSVLLRCPEYIAQHPHTVMLKCPFLFPPPEWLCVMLCSFSKFLNGKLPPCFLLPALASSSSPIFIFTTLAVYGGRSKFHSEKWVYVWLYMWGLYIYGVVLSVLFWTQGKMRVRLLHWYILIYP